MTINSLLLTALAVAPQLDGATADLISGDPIPTLPAPLAWLVDQDDYPLLSRRLVVLEVGQQAPSTVLQPLLYSFDAADYQMLAWHANTLLVNGPVSQSRPSPNVGLPLQWTERRPASGPDFPSGFANWPETFAQLTSKYFYPSPDGRSVLIVGGAQNGLVLLETDGEFGPDPTYSQGPCSPNFEYAKLHPLLPEEGINYRLRGGGWAEDGRAVYLSLGGGRGKTEAGLWRFPFHGWNEDNQPQFGPAKRIVNAPRNPRFIAADGTIFATDRVEPGRYTPHEAFVWFPDPERDSLGLVDDLLYTQQAFLRPNYGLDNPQSKTLELAYVRNPNGQLIYRSYPREHLLNNKQLTQPTDRVIWKAKHRVLSLAWSPDGQWLAFSALDDDRKAQLYAINIAAIPSNPADVGTMPPALHLGPGIRPSWGPLATSHATPD